MIGASGERETGYVRAAAHERQAPSFPVAACWVLVIVGGLLRTVVYLRAEPLWGDEAMLAANFDRPLMEQMTGLNYYQVAPPGFLLLTRLSYLVLGDKELALRLVPLLAGLLALPLFYQLARHVLPPVGTVLAVALFALSPYLIYYSTEVKQYSLDVLVTIAITLATLRTIRGGLSTAAALRLGVVGFVLVWFSQAAVFVLAGLGTVLLAVTIRARLPWRPFTQVAVFWAAGAVIVALASLISQSAETTEFMRHFWANSFLSPENPRQWFQALLMLMKHPGSLTLPFTGLLAMAGLLLVPKKRRMAFALLLAPLGIAFVMSLLQLYPWSPLGDYFRSGRLFLFAAPALILAVAAGAAEFALDRRLLFRLLGILLLMLLPFQPVMVTYAAFRPGRESDLGVRRPSVKPLMARLAAQWIPGDRIFVPASVVPVFDYYADRYPTLKGAIIQPRPASEALPSGRAWFLYQHTADLGGIQRVQQKLSQVGQPVRAYSAGLPALLLFDVHDTRSIAQRQAYAHNLSGVFQVWELVPPSR